MEHATPHGSRQSLLAPLVAGALLFNSKLAQDLRIVMFLHAFVVVHNPSSPKGMAWSSSGVTHGNAQARAIRLAQRPTCRIQAPPLLRRISTGYSELQLQDMRVRYDVCLLPMQCRGFYSASART